MCTKNTGELLHSNLLFLACVAAIQIDFFFVKGWGDDITWSKTYEEGLKKLKDGYGAAFMHR